jgi:3-methylfumaryl-CoA hydratase
MTEAAPDLKAWIGRRRVQRDVVTAGTLDRMAATLDRDDPPAAAGDPVPPLWHWMYFLDSAPVAGLGRDGHPRRGTFLPPVPLPRRMYAGGTFEFLRPLRVGQEIERISTIADVAEKAGRTGPLIFVRVEHHVAGPDGPAIRETQQLVFREDPRPGEASAAPPPEPPPGTPAFGRSVVPTPPLLFRYSALTFNGHRIHYDRPYVTGVEGYPGLIVHGPLLATLLVDLARRQFPGAGVARYEFRAVRPVFDTAPFRIAGRRDGDRTALWATDASGALAMRALATLA